MTFDSSINSVLLQSSLPTADLLDSTAADDRKDKDRGKEEPETVSSLRKGVPTLSVRHTASMQWLYPSSRGSHTTDLSNLGPQKFNVPKKDSSVCVF